MPDRMAANLALAWRVVAAEGIAGLAARLRRMTHRRLRFAQYRWRRRWGWQAPETPTHTLSDDLAAWEVELLASIWRLAVDRPVRVLAPDFLHYPLSRLIACCGPRAITPLAHADLAANANLAFDCCVLQLGQLHRLPLAVVERVLESWSLVATQGSAGIFTLASTAACAEPVDSQVHEALRNMARQLRTLAANDLLYDAPGGARLRCHYSDMELGMIEEVWHEYFGWGITLPDDAVVVDIGANLGAFAVAAGMRVPRGKVLAFEPCPGNFELLAENVARNCPGRVDARRLAVHRDDQPRRLYLDPEHSGAHSLYEKRWAPTSVEVRCVSLPAILAELGQPVDLLKVDAEGSEYEMLFPNGDRIKRQVRTIVMEVHRAGRWNCQDMVDFLKGLGFQVESKGSGNLMLLHGQNPALQAASRAAA